MTKPLYPAVIAALSVTAMSAMAAPAHAGATANGVSVVELFTSQGCSSCPAADKVAGQLTSREGVIILSLPVDYWDYLGWKDTLAQHSFTERQRTYARTRGDGQVYTPQVVVNGLQHAVGSEPDSIDAAISETKSALHGKTVALKLVPDADGLTVELGDAPAGSTGAKASIMLADFKRSADVNIGRGENGGRKVTYYHVVRKLQSVGAWDGKAQTLHLSKADLAAGGSDGCAVFLQSSAGGAILAAAQVTN